MLKHAGTRDRRAWIPTPDIVQFALLTARPAEDMRRRWAWRRGGWVDDGKHPTQKKGNRRSFRILRATMDIIERQLRTALEVFPYNVTGMSAALIRA